MLALAKGVGARPADLLPLAALTLAEVAAQVGVAACGKLALDAALAGDGVGWLTPTLATLFAALAFALIRARQLAQETLALAWRSRGVARLSASIAAADVHDLSSVPMAELREILMTDVGFAARFTIETFAQTLIIGIWLLATIGVTVWIAPVLLPVLLGVGLLATAAMALGLRRHLSLAGERFRAIADLSQSARDVVEVERVVLTRQFGLGRVFIDGFLAAHGRYVEVTHRQNRVAAGVRAGVLMLGPLAFLAVAIGGAALADENLTGGGLIAVLFVLGQLAAGVAQLSEFAGRAAEMATSGRWMGAYWEADGRFVQPDAALRVESLAAESVEFGYFPGRPVLKDVSLRVERGQLVALTAATGAGKTTLAMVLGGLLAPDAGRVIVNGDPAVTPRHVAPGRILYVGPKPVLVEGAAADNLLSDADPAELERHLDWFFTDLSVDWRSLRVDANGHGVSSGQGQLLQLARATLRDPDVVLLDEATGHLDMPTESIVQERLLPWCKRRGTLVISHRQCPWVVEADARATV